MDRENPPDLQVAGWLKSLGIESLCQWDVLVFLCRHLASLVSAEHIARLLGYETGAVVAALDSLESLALVDRSRADQGVRLYQFAAPGDTGRSDTLGHLLMLADKRTGRLLLTKMLRRCEPSKRNNGPSPWQDRGSATWLKAI